MPMATLHLVSLVARARTRFRQLVPVAEQFVIRGRLTQSATSVRKTTWLRFRLPTRGIKVPASVNVFIRRILRMCPQLLMATL